METEQFKYSTHWASVFERWTIYFTWEYFHSLLDKQFQTRRTALYCKE